MILLRKYIEGYRVTQEMNFKIFLLFILDDIDNMQLSSLPDYKANSNVCLFQLKFEMKLYLKEESY